MKNIVILGSCRQSVLEEKYNVSGIKEEISYPHYTKEIIQVVSYCLNNDVPENKTCYTFRTPALNNKPLKWKTQYRSDIENADVVFIEIASLLTYRLENRYVHHILYDEKAYNEKVKEEIVVGELTRDEVYADVRVLKNMIKRPIIIVSHLVTKPEGKRYELLNMLREVCLEESILFIEPVNELIKMYGNVDGMFSEEKKLSHYTHYGHQCILKVYERFMDSLSDSHNLLFFQKRNTQYKKRRYGSKHDGGYVIADGLTYDMFLSCGINHDISFENDFLNAHDVPCVSFDGTIKEMPKGANAKIEFIRKNIGDTESENTTNLEIYLKKHKNIFLKMDIETWEFIWFNKISNGLLNNISQMVIEIHFPWTISEHIFSSRSKVMEVSKKISIIRKMFIHHNMIHIHGNSACGIVNINKKILPNVIECTFLHKKHDPNTTFSISTNPDPLLDNTNIPNTTEIVFKL